MNELAIAPPTALGVHVTERLRHRIVSGAIPPGTHLVEGKLSELFEVSRGPIRDALRQLQQEGLVESRRRGVFVLGLTEDDIDELYSLRTLLEGEALRLCLQREDADWSAAQAAVDTMTAAAKVGDVETFADADLAFHTTLYAISGHRRLGAIWAQYRPTFAAMLSVTNAQDARNLNLTLTDHVDLLAAARKGDETKIRKLLIDHMAGSQGRMKKAHAKAIAASIPSEGGR